MRGWCLGIAAVAIALTGCTGGAGVSSATASAAARSSSPAVASAGVSVGPAALPSAGDACATPPASPAVSAGTPSRCGCDATATYPGVPVKAVSLHGDGFFTRATTVPDIRRGLGLPSEARTVADGRFLDRLQQWDEGPVWWELGPGADPADTWIRLDLDGSFTLVSAIVQADDNDSYVVSYRDPASGDWARLWTVPTSYSFGMITRPDQYDDSARHMLPAPVTSDAIRIAAGEGDGMYAVSEAQFFGTLASE